jgi:hypothetical protein
VIVDSAGNVTSRYTASGFRLELRDFHWFVVQDGADERRAMAVEVALWVELRRLRSETT